MKKSTENPPLKKLNAKQLSRIEQMTSKKDIGEKDDKYINNSDINNKSHFDEKNNIKPRKPILDINKDNLYDVFNQWNLFKKDEVDIELVEDFKRRRNEFLATLKELPKDKFLGKNEEELMKMWELEYSEKIKHVETNANTLNKTVESDDADILKSGIDTNKKIEKLMNELSMDEEEHTNDITEKFVENQKKQYKKKIETENNAPPTTKQTAPPTTKQTAPPTTKQTAPPNIKQTAPPTTKQTAPPTTKQTAPPNIKQTAPPNIKQTAPPNIKQTAPPNINKNALKSEEPIYPNENIEVSSDEDEDDSYFDGNDNFEDENINEESLLYFLFGYVKMYDAKPKNFMISIKEKKHFSKLYIFYVNDNKNAFKIFSERCSKNIKKTVQNVAEIFSRNYQNQDNCGSLVIKTIAYDKK